MKKKLTIILIIGLIIFIGLFSYFIINFLFESKNSNNNLIDSDNLQELNESEAIYQVQLSYPEYNAYPSDKLAPKSIKTEYNQGIWYISFIQEGSGRPLIFANCFSIDNQKNINFIGEYIPKTIEESNFSILTCR